MIQVIEKNEGTKLAYELVGSKLFFGDDEIMVNLAKYEQDFPVAVMICPMPHRSTFPPALIPRLLRKRPRWTEKARWSRPSRSLCRSMRAAAF